ncbi:N-acetylmuramoyl-L-alanine amidase [Carboxydothermus ferrireducens]|uniref:N-acetylmuramoyl-L-alanine amidase n=1 Tax=Carboxydothermus ferrireducens DSM 11255 TaxID=1119529 RepID=A0ABX2RA30_9THEO|nr:N-acetylmuramoyl-L-alanine amidase [Carboxydothermus ferrireducens]NYE57785.1 N-acetylmuramoyl-L-alanine amidase [Carboxydothermus ferrireducens DSM 11255]
MRKGYRSSLRGQALAFLLVFLFSIFFGFRLPVLAASYGVVTASTLNVRSGPGINYAKIGVLTRGQKVELTGKTGEWFKIRYKNGYGYVSGKYISPVVGSSRSTQASRTGIVTATILNVRKTPSTSAAIAGKLAKNTRVEIYKEQNGWYYIKAGSIAGWVVKTYIKVTETSRGTTPTPPQSSTNTSIKTISGVYAVKATNLNLRSGPGTSYSVIKTLPQGTKVEGLQVSGDWMKVKAGSITGWVAKAFLVPFVEDTSRGDTLRIIKTVYPMIDPVNIFNGAGFSTGVKATISGEKSFGVLEEKDGWYRLALAGREIGWAEKAYFSDTPVEPVHPVQIKGETAPASLTWQITTTANLTYTLSNDRLTAKIVLENGQIDNITTPDLSFPVKSLTTATENGNVAVNFAGFVPLNLAVEKINGGYNVRIFPEPVLSGKKIVLDPGHGGSDPGTIGKVYGIKEKDVNLDIALKLKGYLEALGAAVYMTRTGDTYLSLQQRVDYANDLSADLFLSIHQNSVGSPAYYSTNGTQVYYYPDPSNQLLEKALADKLMSSLNEVLGSKNKGIYTDKGYYVIKYTEMPSTLVEVGFLSNAEEEKKLSTPEYRTKAAAALAQGITKWFLGK